MARTLWPFGSPGLLRGRGPLARGLCGLFIGWCGHLKADVSEVVLHAGRAAELVMACATPQINGPVDPAIPRIILDEVYGDLARSGAVQPLRDSDLTPTGRSDNLAMRQAGATLLLKTVLKRSWTGKLILGVDVTDLGTGAGVFRKSYTTNATHVRSTVHRVADDVVGALTGIPGVASSRILFVHELAPGLKEIYQVDPGGGNPVRLTHHESLTLSPSVARDGRLAYVTYVGGLPRIWAQLRPGEVCRSILPTGHGGYPMTFTPAWSRDGRHLAFVAPGPRGDSDISVVKPDSGRIRKLTDHAGINTEPAWSPSGQQIVFTSDRDGTPQLYLMEADGSNVRRLTREGAYNASPAWSPDGGMIAYVSRMDGRFNLFVYKLAEGKAYQITRSAVSAESPAWSPDGRWLAYASDQDGKRNLFVTDLAGTRQRRLLEMEGCQSPFWTRSR